MTEDGTLERLQHTQTALVFPDAALLGLPQWATRLHLTLRNVVKCLEEKSKLLTRSRGNYSGYQENFYDALFLREFDKYCVSDIKKALFCIR